MDRMEFISALEDKIMEHIPEDEKNKLTFRHQEVTKINDQKMYGLSFQREGANAAPTIYINDAFEEYKNGQSLEKLAESMAAVYMDCKDNMPVQFETPTQDLAYEHIRGDVTMRLLEIRRNRDFLQERPYMSVGHGLAVVCDIQVHDKEKSGVVSITNDMAENNGYDKRTLFDNAMHDAWNNSEPTLYDMESSMMGLKGENLLLGDSAISADEKSMMYVLSNRESMYGAASLFYPDVQEKISSRLGEGYYALPSSLHEYLIVPDSAGIETRNLVDMVHSANRTEGVVAAKDVLSDQVLHYDKDARALEAVVSQRQMGDKLMEAR